MLWVLRCIVAVGAIYWFSPLRTEQPVLASRADVQSLVHAIRQHPEVARAVASEAAAGGLSGLQHDGAGLASHPGRPYMSRDASPSDPAVRR